MMRITMKAAWASGVLLLLCSGCKGISSGSRTPADRETGKVGIGSTTHYLSGQVVLVERSSELLRVREAVELHKPEIKTLRLTASTIVVKGNGLAVVDQIKRGDYVLIRYSVEPDGSSCADEIRLVSKLDARPFPP